MTMSVEYVRAKLTIKTIPNIIGETSYKAINEIKEALYGNVSGIPMELEGGGGGVAVDASVY